MKTEGTNLLLLTISAFWSSSRWPMAAPEGSEVSHSVVVIDRFHCIQGDIVSLIWCFYIEWSSNKQPTFLFIVFQLENQYIIGKKYALRPYHQQHRPQWHCTVPHDEYNARRIYIDMLYVLCRVSSSPWTKWPSFRRRYLQMHFREWKSCILIKILHYLHTHRSPTDYRLQLT